MAERIISPGVFTNEVDQSFLAGGIAQIGAAIVGPTLKGPALIPTTINSMADYRRIFGSTEAGDNSYISKTVEEYLRNSGTITVTRLLYEDGYKLNQGALAIVATSGSTSIVTHVLHPGITVTTTGTDPVFEHSTLADAGSGVFALKVSGSYSKATGTDADAIGFSGTYDVAMDTNISCSINPNNNQYVVKRFGNKPSAKSLPVYVQYENPTAYASFSNIAAVSMSLVKINNFSFENRDYETAATPWITSQKVGSVAKDLFQFHTLSHGNFSNHEIKVGILDIQASTEVADSNGYGKFTVEVRRVNTENIADTVYNSTDTDKNPAIIETFRGVTLDPTSPNYIARRIGDRYQTITDSNDIIRYGDYVNQSNYIRVQVDKDVATGANSKTLIPFGFRALETPIPNASGSNLAAVTFKTSQVQTSYNRNNYFGFDFDSVNNLNYLAPLPSGSVTGSNTDFYLGNMTQNQEAAFGTDGGTGYYTGSLETALTAGTFTTNVAVSTRKFIVPFQGGFDGARPNLPKYVGEYIADTNTYGFNCSSAASTGTKAYNKAFTILSNSDYYDFNLLLTPGIIHSLHDDVTALAIELCESRQDAFYLLDSNPLTATLTNVVTTVASLDTSYAATYWPWVQTSINGTLQYVPPSVLVPAALSFNDKNKAPWYAPAGFGRGRLSAATDTYVNLSNPNRDTLYEARVNPIAQFPGNNIVIWGQKTLQARPSALDRVNVRRLLLAVKKFIASSTKYLVFEQNTDVTRNRFLSIVEPYMRNVQANQGLYAFRVVMDGTNNTPDIIDRNILYGQIFLQPTRTAEFIVLDFNIQPTGATIPG